jgi:hypothetical protein
MANITGWGRGSWSEGAWNSPLPVVASGVSATANDGSVTVDAEANVPETGLEATSGVGSVTVTGAANVSETGLEATGSVGSVTVAANAGVSVVGFAAQGNPELGGALNAEYFVPTDTDDPNITVMAFEASTTVSADGSSLGTISSAGGTLTVSASNYENKIISADKPITLQSGDNQTVGVPTSWAGTSFGFRNTRTGFVLQMRALYGTASVEIFKDGVSTTTLSVGSTATTTQSYADDTSDPEYTVFSDLPIIVFKTRGTSLSGDSRPAFPASTDFLYGFASGSAAAVLVDGYGGTAQTFTRFASDGSSVSSTISTVLTSFAAGTDFTGPSNRYQTAKASAAFSIADSDGGEKTSFIPEGCFAHEFRLIEAAEFVNFIGAPGTNGRNIEVYNSSGTLIDTIQLATSNTGSDFPTKFQLISDSTTDSNLSPNAKSYDLTAGMRFVSEVPVGAVVEDDSSDRESNLFGLRNFGGQTSAAAVVSVTGSEATSAVGTVTLSTAQNLSVTGSEGTGAVGSVTVRVIFNVAVTGVEGTGEVGSVTIDAGAVVPETGLEASSGVGSVTVDAAAVVAVSGSEATGEVGDETVTTQQILVQTGEEATAAVGSVVPVSNNNIDVTGEEATSAVGDETVVAAANVAVSGSEATGEVGDETVTADANVPETGLEATGEVGSVVPVSNNNIDVTGAEGTGEVDSVTVDAQAIVSVTGEDATGQIGSTTVVIGITVVLTGEEATGSLNSVTVVGEANVPATGIEATASVGEVSLVTNNNIDVTGIGLTASQGTAVALASADVQVTSDALQSGLGSVTVTGLANVPATGIVGTGQVGSVLVWSQIVPSQSPSWSAVSPSQSPSWSTITTGVSDNWEDIAA